MAGYRRRCSARRTGNGSRRRFLSSSRDCSRSSLRSGHAGARHQLQQRGRRPTPGLSTFAAAEPAGQVVDKCGRRMTQHSQVDVPFRLAARAFDPEPWGATRIAPPLRQNGKATPKASCRSNLYHPSPLCLPALPACSAYSLSSACLPVCLPTRPSTCPTPKEREEGEKGEEGERP